MIGISYWLSMLSQSDFISWAWLSYGLFLLLNTWICNNFDISCAWFCSNFLAAVTWIKDMSSMMGTKSSPHPCERVRTNYKEPLSLFLLHDADNECRSLILFTTRIMQQKSWSGSQSHVMLREYLERLINRGFVEMKKGGAGGSIKACFISCIRVFTAWAVAETDRVHHFSLLKL